MEKFRAKYVVSEVTHTVLGTKIKLMPVTSGSEENEKLFELRPCGQIELGIINSEVSRQFEPGKEFYIDFLGKE